MKKVILSIILGIILTTSFLQINSVPAYATSHAVNITFDQSPAIIEHSGFVVVDDSSKVNEVLTDTIDVIVSSSSESMTLTISESADGVFHSSLIKFTTLTGGPADELTVPDPSLSSVTVTAEYVDAFGTSFTATVNVLPTIGVSIGDLPNRRQDSTWTSCGTDADSDGICDNWETQSPTAEGLNINFPGTGSEVYQVGCDIGGCPSPDRKDIYLELDYMQGHRPDLRALQALVDAFATAPVDNPAGPDGITLHIQLDDVDTLSIPHDPETPFPGTNVAPPGDQREGFDQMKAKFFGLPSERNADWTVDGWKQKKMVFHYGLIIHAQAAALTSTGTGEVFGNDFVISLGSLPTGVGTTQEQAGTIMHELGHNLRLNHGGGPTDVKNCKPNYLSVMSYSRQFPDLVIDRDLNYSSKQLGNAVSDGTQLSEATLYESYGVESNSPAAEEHIVWGPIPPLPPLPMTGGSAVDWDVDSIPDEIDYNININRLVDAGCTSLATNDLLPGYNDWANINLKNQGTGAWYDGRVTDMTDVLSEEGEFNPATLEWPFVLISRERVVAGGALTNTPMPPSSLTAILPTIIAGSPVIAGTEYLTLGDEVTLEDIRAMRVLLLLSLEREISRLPATAFADPDQAKSIKENYFFKKINEIKDLVRHDRMVEAGAQLEELAKTYDGDNSDVADKITSPFAQELFEGSKYTTTSYYNSVDFNPAQFVATDEIPTRDEEFCSTFTGETAGHDYKISYCISNGSLTKGTIDSESKSMKLSITPDGDGSIKVTIPRDVMDAKIEDSDDDDDFFVLVEGEEAEFDEEKDDDSRSLTISFANDIEEIEIIGTFVVPEFGTSLFVTLIISIVTMMFIGMRMKNRLNLN